jgi:hypothetical protein
MSILPTAALTTVQIVSGLAASAKNALDLSKASADHDLKAAVGELYDSVLDVKGRVLDLDEEVRNLKVQLARREEIEGPDVQFGYFHFKSKPDKPPCPKCYQSVPPNIANMGPRQEQGSYIMRRCPVCGFFQREGTVPTSRGADPHVGIWS